MIPKSEMSEEEAIECEKAEIRHLKSEIKEIEEMIKNSPSKHNREYLNLKQVKKTMIRNITDKYGLQYDDSKKIIYNGWGKEV